MKNQRHKRGWARWWVWLMLIAVLFAPDFVHAAKHTEKHTKKEKTSSADMEKEIAAFVEKHLATSKLPKREGAYDPEKAPAAYKMIQNAPNYNKIPPQYRALIDANKDKCFAGLDGGATAYMGEEFHIRLYKNRLIFLGYKLDASNMMAIFEPAKDAKPFLTIPAATLKKMSDEDRAYVETLRDIVNENVAFLWDVPFFVPDMKRFDNGDYAGKFIPEKYMVSGRYLDDLPSHLIDDSKREIQRRWGFPIYDISQVETGEIFDPSGCFYHSDYTKMKVVSTLTLLNWDMMEPKNKQNALHAIRFMQYTRVQKNIAFLKKAPEKELKALEESGQLTPDRKKILDTIQKQFDKMIPQAEKTLQTALDKGQFIYTLRQPNGKPKRMVKQSDIFNPEYTSGRVKTE